MTEPITPPAHHSGITEYVTRRVGPLPVWAWVVLAIAAYLAWQHYQSSKTAASSSATDTASTPADNTPPEIFQDYVTVTGTPPAVPPSGGRTNPPAGGTSSPPAGGASGSATSTPPKIGTPVPPITGGVGPTPTPHPAGTTVTVARNSSTSPVWNSTLSGIAQHEGYGGDWQAIWNAPANAALKTRRKTPDLIRAGDKIIVPAK